MSWKALYTAAFELALDRRDVDEAATVLLRVGGSERATFAIARFHFLGQADDYPADRELHAALAYVEHALYVGDSRDVWSSSSPVNIWDFGQHDLVA